MQTDFSDAVLKSVFFVRSDLRMVNFTRTHATVSLFSGSDMRNANMQEMVMDKPRITESNLTGSDLSGMRMSGGQVFDSEMPESILHADVADTMFVYSKKRPERHIEMLAGQNGNTIEIREQI
ncbi:MAG: Pentapeptide repeats (8 copies) [candidate division WS6 bacterium OLB20]|uniref:Pentapeptide repeats (8 copies) n=1 Tax=candidate division WS6 bacterium OLB20 TaxID=1617426 RepID=A0A136LYG3_9BACT|nr:MAG: Pentapeptide repeats (8 copies) [candidate division WS6 bacterium OLB20]